VLPDTVKLFIEGDATKLTTGKADVPPVVMFEPGCTNVVVIAEVIPVIALSTYFFVTREFVRKFAE
jgi:hypothetical protein